MTPRATLRLQLHRGFPFAAARGQLPYFARLGISHLYLSPILAARAGSLHGYDVVDHAAVNPELGGEDGLRLLARDCRARGLGLVVDIVPNHMAVGNHDNAWWLDLLRWGRDSAYAGFFDVDWDVPDPALRNRVLAPFLGQPYGAALRDGGIALRLDSRQGFYAAHHEHHFPIAAEHHAGLLALGGAALEGLAAQFGDGARGGRGARRQRFARSALALGQAAEEPPVAAALRRVLLAHDARHDAGRARLHHLLQAQHWRLAWWRCAPDEINWRRFFDVTELAGLRVQDHAVFEAVHATMFRLYAEGLVDGLRVDHVDGLAYPRDYCRRLRRRLRKLAAQRPPDAPPGPAYLVVEKILAPGELLASDWLVDGTSGYAFMNQAGAVLHDAAGEAPLRVLWSARSGRSARFAEEEQAARRRIPQDMLAADFSACAHALHRIARSDLATRDWSLNAVRRVLAELLAHFPVYRTYADARGRSAADAAIMAGVVDRAAPGCRPGEAPLLRLVDAWLGGEPPLRAHGAQAQRLRLQAIARFQQLTAPVAAKSVEDTAFYRHGTLLSRNEVGADPGQFAMSVEEFHQACASRLQRHPRAMLATATHDHKRGEDLRARLAVLSEMPRGWAEAVERWAALAAPLKNAVEGVHGPDATDEYMLYQMLAGAWPPTLHPGDAAGVEALRARLDAWQRKAVREAKRHSGWIEPNLPYEQACADFLRRLLGTPAFTAELAQLAGRIAAPGALNGLSQTLLRLTTPGVPDLYQGCEWWDFSLVDPDNRRAVDWSARAAALEQDVPPDGLLAQWRDGRIKQRLIARLLADRARRPLLYARGVYEPLQVEGPAARHLVAFARRHGGEALLVLAPRLPGALLRDAEQLRAPDGAWRDTRVLLPPALRRRGWRGLLDQTRLAAGAGIEVAVALRVWPLAALAADSSSP